MAVHQQYLSHEAGMHSRPTRTCVHLRTRARMAVVDHAFRLYPEDPAGAVSELLGALGLLTSADPPPSGIQPCRCGGC